MEQASTKSHVAAYRKAFESEEYCPSVMLNFVIHKLGLKNDFALAMTLGCSPNDISIVRARREPVGDMLLLRCSEATDIGTKELKRLAGILPAL